MHADTVDRGDGPLLAGRRESRGFAPSHATARVERRADGGVEITYRVAEPLEIVRFSLGWGAEAEVVAPEEMRRAAASLAREVAARYGEQEQAEHGRVITGS